MGLMGFRKRGENKKGTGSIRLGLYHGRGRKSFDGRGEWEVSVVR